MLTKCTFVLRIANREFLTIVNRNGNCFSLDEQGLDDAAPDTTQDQFLAELQTEFDENVPFLEDDFSVGFQVPVPFAERVIAYAASSHLQDAAGLTVAQVIAQTFEKHFWSDVNPFLASPIVRQGA